MYARSLEKLANHPFSVSQHGTLSMAIKSMKADCANKAL